MGLGTVVWEKIQYYGTRYSGMGLGTVAWD